MYNEKFLGEIQSISAGIITVKDTDGTKIKQGVYKVKLSSADIDYKSIEKFNPNISATLLNIQPMPMQGINFGEQSAYKMQLNLYAESQELFENKDLEASFGNVLIKNLTVKIVEQIPVYIFSLELPMSYDGRFLFKNIKQRISFEFAEMEKSEMTTKLFSELKIGDKFKLNKNGFIIYEKNGNNHYKEHSHGLSILENPKQKDMQEDALFCIVYPVSEV